MPTVISSIWHELRDIWWSRWLKNTTIDVVYMLPTELADPEVRQRLVELLRTTLPDSALRSKMAQYIQQFRDF